MIKLERSAVMCLLVFYDYVCSLISYLISEIALYAVLMPAIYQERAFRGKLSILSR
jgi:hypothetical protein